MKKYLVKVEYGCGDESILEEASVEVEAKDEKEAIKIAEEYIRNNLFYVSTIYIKKEEEKD